MCLKILLVQDEILCSSPELKTKRTKETLQRLYITPVQDFYNIL